VPPATEETKKAQGWVERGGGKAAEADQESEEEQGEEDEYDWVFTAPWSDAEGEEEESEEEESEEEEKSEEEESEEEEKSDEEEESEPPLAMTWQDSLPERSVVLDQPRTATSKPLLARRFCWGRGKHPNHGWGRGKIHKDHGRGKITLRYPGPLEVYQTLDLALYSGAWLLFR
jgi:hypothetical protein